MNKRTNLILAVDHGNGDIKTVNTSFVAGLEVSNVPINSVNHKDIIQYNSKWYAIADNPKPYKRDKTNDESYFILTLFAIAKEIIYNMNNGATIDTENISIKLPVGLPLSHYNTGKDDFKNYFIERFNGGVSFDYIYDTEDGKQKVLPFNVELDVCSVHAQGYSGAMTTIFEKGKDNDYTLIDIGSFTVDVADYEDGKVREDNMRSFETGTIVMCDHIANKLSQSFGVSPSAYRASKIIKILKGKKEDKYKEVIFDEAKKWADSIINTVIQSRFALETSIPVLLGGGSLLLRSLLEDNQYLENAVFVGSVNANARGYALYASKL